MTYIATVPEDYVCSDCKVSGKKLWRYYQSFHVELFCATCALRKENKEGPVDANGKRMTNTGPTDQIGGLVPAVPTPEGGSYWGYTSVPTDGVAWWKELPT